MAELRPGTPQISKVPGMTQTRGAAAKALGLTTDKLHAALQSGKSLADVAKDQKVSVVSVVKSIVAATEDALANAVKDDTLTHAQAACRAPLAHDLTDLSSPAPAHHERPHHRCGRSVADDHERWRWCRVSGQSGGGGI
jgi:hypothetical protein